MNYNVGDIKSLESESDQELWAQVGYSLTKDQPRLGESDQDDLAEEGQSWWQQNLSRLRTVFCASGLLRDIPRKSQETRIQLIITIADVVAQHFTGVPPLNIAILLIRHGHEQLCNNQGQGENLAIHATGDLVNDGDPGAELTSEPAVSAEESESRESPFER